MSDCICTLTFTTADKGKNIACEYVTLWVSTYITAGEGYVCVALYVQVI